MGGKQNGASMNAKTPEVRDIYLCRETDILIMDGGYVYWSIFDRNGSFHRMKTAVKNGSVAWKFNVLLWNEGHNSRTKRKKEMKPDLET